MYEEYLSINGEILELAEYQMKQIFLYDFYEKIVNWVNLYLVEFVVRGTKTAHLFKIIKQKVISHFRPSLLNNSRFNLRIMHLILI